MVIAAVAIVALIVAPLGTIPTARDDLDAALDERNAIHQYAVAIEHDTLRALGGLSGGITMAASEAALERWARTLDAEGIPSTHRPIHEEAAAGHAVLSTAVASLDPATVAPAFNSALEAASAGLRASNELIDRRLSQLTSAAPAQARLETGILEARDHLETDRATARLARAMGQVGVEIAVAQASTTGRVTLALLEAERSAQAFSPDQARQAADALALSSAALGEVRRLLDDDQVGPRALATLWPPLQAALAALEDARVAERSGLADALQHVEQRAFTAAWLASIIVVGFAATAPVAVWILQRRVVKPIIALHAATEHPSATRVVAADYAGRADEIGELARSFAQMSDRIAETHRQLTYALAESNSGREALQRSFQLLAEADRLRQHILNTASHELRTPLTPMKIHMNLLKGEKQGPLTEAQRRSLDALDANMTRLVGVITSMAQMHALQEGQAPVHIADIDAADVAMRACEAARPVMEAAEISLSWEPRGAALARGDPERLRQVLDIVLDNARRYTPVGGHVTVRAGDGPVIEVEDDGRGMAPEDMERMFHPFERGMGQQHDAPGAAGLGLAIARAIMERMGGAITGRSEGPGLGSTFRLELPGPNL